MKKLLPVWLTIDSDDIFHHPKFQGHPTRSKKQIKNNSMSEQMKFSFEKLNKWHEKNIDLPITIFLIGEQLECNNFKHSLENLIKNNKNWGGKITIGCHGYKHRCWSAFGPDQEGFRKDLQNAKKIIIRNFKKLWRPWFRAPGGYIAPWMANVLKLENFELDSSINPTRFLSIKSGKSEKGFGFNGWDSVDKAINEVEIVERPWLTTFFPAFPACGPALHIPILKIFASSTWKKYTNHRIATDDEIVNKDLKITTVYWHLLDFHKNNGKWVPPLRII